MDPQIAIDTGRQAVHTVLLLGAPVLIVAAAVGIVIGILQAVTQIHDPAILFVSRLVAVVVVLSICLPWLVEQYTGYSREVIRQIPENVVAGPAHHPPP